MPARRLRGAELVAERAILTPQSAEVFAKVNEQPQPTLCMGDEVCMKCSCRCDVPVDTVRHLETAHEGPVPKDFAEE